VVDTQTDTLTEAAGGGTDTVQSSVTFTLGANLENLTLTGAAAIDGTGNTLNNVLTGNAAANVLTGNAGNDTLNGGGGVDTLVGGVGNDTYVVDTTTDVITEAAAAGTDTVQSSVTFALGAGSNLENLTLTGAAAIDGTGNALDNLLTGNAAANLLSGDAGSALLRGGAGADTLTGGADAVADTFDFDLMTDTGVGAGLRDTITDFIGGVDKIDFSTIDAITGTVANDAFVAIGTAAFTAAGQLRYEFDGVNTLVQGNVGGANGNVVDFELVVLGNHPFPVGTGDFVL
jgi:Ca2+-binding RTX toxin-like protein